MKRKTSAVVMGVMGLFVCAGFCIAEDADLMAFDTAYKNPQEAVKSQAKKVELPMVSQGTNTNEAAAPLVVVMKDLLKGLPAEDRADFLASLVLKNGRIVSADLSPLRKNYAGEEIDKVVKTIFYRPEGKTPRNTGSPARFAEMSKLLKGVPADVRNEFLGSLTFKDGSFVSAHIGGLRRAVEGERMDEIVKAIATSSGPLRPFDAKTLCGDGECYDAQCYNPNSAGWRCRSHVNSVCDSSCHD